MSWRRRRPRPDDDTVPVFLSPGGWLGPPLEMTAGTAEGPPRSIAPPVDDDLDECVECGTTGDVQTVAIDADVEPYPLCAGCRALWAVDPPTDPPY